MTVKYILFIILPHCANARIWANDPLYCYSSDPIRLQISMFGTMTPYDEVRGQAINSNVSKCSPSRLWFLGRHGTRLPSTSDRDNLFSSADTIKDDILRNYNSSQTKLCPADVELIKTWTSNLSSSGNLTASGWNEIKSLASRMQKAFPTLLSKHYTPEHYYFRGSPSPRTTETARAFAEGLFGSMELKNVQYDGGHHPDPYLLSFYYCPTWLSFNLNYTQAKLFAKGQEYQQMIKRVSDKLGFQGSAQLNETSIDKLISHCKYEQIYDHHSLSALCSAFSIADHQVIEYYRDLQFYYSAGYGNPGYRKLYKTMSCTLLQAMLKFLQSNDEADQKAKLWFGHDMTLLFMFNALGLFEDEVPLSDSNFAQQTMRKWKTSFLTPMGGNIAVVRFE